MNFRDEWIVVQNVQFDPRTKAKEFVKMLDEAGKRHSLSTVKQVLCLRGLKGLSVKKKPLLTSQSEKKMCL